MSDPGILKSVWITGSRTVIVTVVSVLYTAMFTYAFSRPYLKAKWFYAAVGFASMYFGGGLIPSFMLINWLGLYDSYLVYILPALFGGFWNVIIFNANFKAIPVSLFESAKMDGANEFTMFFRIVLLVIDNWFWPRFRFSQPLRYGTITRRPVFHPIR